MLIDLINGVNQNGDFDVANSKLIFKSRKQSDLLSFGPFISHFLEVLGRNGNIPSKCLF